MKERPFATVLTMILAASLMIGRGLGKAVDSTVSVTAETMKIEGGENSKGVGNGSDAAAGRAGTVADETGPSGGVGALVGVTMPTKDPQGRNRDSVSMKAELEAADYEVDLQYASNDIQTQISQTEDTIFNGCQMLVVASMDGNPSGELLGQAKEVGIPAISYDRLIVDSDVVIYYIIFDNYKVGQKQGECLVEALGFETAIELRNIELFIGDPVGNSRNLSFGGVMDVLQEYIDEGKLVMKPGQIAFEQAATVSWDPKKTQNRMDTIIAGDYPNDIVLGAILCSNGSAVLGMENALVSSYTGTYFVITSQDRDITNVKDMPGGKQAMSVFKNIRTLVTQAVRVVDAVMQGGEVEVNDSSSYDNGADVISTCLYESVVITANNYEEMLMDSGYYTEDQIKQISIQKRISLSAKRRGKTNSRDGWYAKACLDHQVRRVGSSRT